MTELLEPETHHCECGRWLGNLEYDPENKMFYRECTEAKCNFRRYYDNGRAVEPEKKP
jgi:Ni,Fe-hydrogenase I small subunit